MSDRTLFLLFFSLLLFGCTEDTALPETAPAPEAIALTGDSLYAATPAAKLLEDLAVAEADYLADSNNIDNIVWYGRRLAYPGYYRRSIDVFSRGIERFPEEAVLYRHRGHRYVTIRKFDEAIADLERAAQLIEGSEDEVEPDGMPNAQNIPLTTLHSNIYYHLGLAYYLEYDWEKAQAAYEKCRNLGLNDDNLVSSTHWLYMIHRRMGDTVAARRALEPIHAEMNIIENQSYYKLCRFYRGELEESQLVDPNDAASANDAVRYGVANWHYYNGREEEAGERLMNIVAAEGWNSFGHIAAEVDLVELFPESLPSASPHNFKAAMDEHLETVREKHEIEGLSLLVKIDGGTVYETQRGSAAEEAKRPSDQRDVHRLFQRENTAIHSALSARDGSTNPPEGWTALSVNGLPSFSLVDDPSTSVRVFPETKTVIVLRNTAARYPATEMIVNDVARLSLPTLSGKPLTLEEDVFNLVLQRHFSVANVAYGKLRRENPDYDFDALRTTINRIAEYVSREGDLQAAMAVYEFNAANNPDWWIAHAMLGQIYEAVDHPSGALESYRRAVELNVGNELNYNQRMRERIELLGAE